MCDELILLDDFDNDDTMHNSVIKAYNPIRCSDCSLILENNNPHCCRCGYVWSDKNVLYCEKCYKNNKVYFNKNNIDISHIINRFNGESNVCNRKGEKIYSGVVRNGKYNGHGILFDIENQNIRYIGDFKDNEYHGMGTMLDQKMITVGFFEKSEIKNQFKIFKCNKKTKIGKDICNLCCEEYDEFNLFPICGISNCSYCCIKCIKSYFENINCSRGSRLNKNMILCPFCRSKISQNIIKIYNPSLDKYIEDIEKIKEPKEIVSLCWDCDKNLVRKLNEECGEHESREKFICEECIETKSFENVKNCPNCKIKVYRIDGCHWMLCKCKKAWCWHCLKIMDPHEGHGINCKYCGGGY